VLTQESRLRNKPLLGGELGTAYMDTHGTYAVINLANWAIVMH